MNKRNDFEVDDFIMPDSSKTVFIKNSSARDITINIFGPIEDPARYAKELDTLRNATEEDQVRMFICSPGGWMDTASLFINAMAECRAPILCEIDNAASAATMIALSATAWKLTPRSIFMVHNCTYGTYGKDSDVYAEVVFSRQHHRVVMKEIYDGFLTDEEIEHILEGKEYYFSGEELKNRLKRYGAKRREKYGAPPLDEEEEFEIISNESKLSSKDPKQNDEEFEDVELDKKDPSTWPEDTKVRLLQAHNGFKKGTIAVIIGIVEGSLGDIIELATKNAGYMLITPEEYSKLEYVE
jgi:ATP-dependent protease ClpP protease subunit